MTADKLRLTYDRRVIVRTTGEVIARLEGPESWDSRKGWIIKGEPGVLFPTAGSAMRELAMRRGL